MITKNNIGIYFNSILFALLLIATPSWSASIQKNTSSFENQIQAYSQTSFSRGLEKRDEASGTLTLGINYFLKKSLLLSGSLTYSNTFAKFEDPYIRGFEDLSLSLSFLQNSGWLKSYTFGLFLPTSQTSQDAGMRFSLNSSASFGYKIQNLPVTVLYSPSLNYSNHEFDTADKAGFVPNFNRGLSNGLGLQIAAGEKLSFVSLYSFHSLWDYLSEQLDLQELYSSVNYQLQKQLTVSLTHTWKSQVISNHSLFDLENSILSIGIKYEN